MKKRLQGLIAGVLIGAVLTSGVAFSKQLSEKADIFFNDIKIFIDGGEIVPKDANGNVVEPFIMNGTTYLPVRAISNALGKEVEWDGVNHSIYIGKKDATKPDNYLSKIQYNDYKEGSEYSDFTMINGSITDYNGNNYTSGILFFKRRSSLIQEDSDEANILIAYPLNSQFKNMKGKIVLPKSYDINTWGKKDNVGSSGTDVWFYGDGKLLYKATNVTASMPFALDIDTTGVNQLVIKIKTQDNDSHIALSDMALYK